MTTIAETCPYKFAARLTSPVWGATACTILLAGSCLTPVSTCFTCCCWNYNDAKNGEHCTPRGLSNKQLDACGQGFLKWSSFYPNITEDDYKNQFLEEATKVQHIANGFAHNAVLGAGGAVPEGRYTWTTHCYACLSSACRVSNCALCCGVFTTPCACCSTENDIAIMSFKNSATGAPFKGWDQMH
ncbi:MAG TPA: hypothetical protein VLE96_04255 [Chlamydiales bacterium]|nr:hypothetical protein [Chlamydiales bacterium]